MAGNPAASRTLSPQPLPPGGGDKVVGEDGVENLEVDSDYPGIVHTRLHGRQRRRMPDHRPKLVGTERDATVPDPHLGEEHRRTILQEDGHGHECPDRSRHHEPNTGQHTVERPLQHAASFSTARGS